MRDNKAGHTGEAGNEVAPVAERTVTGQWLPGHGKRGGRKPGVKNWNSRILAEAKDCDALEVLMEVVLTGYLPLTPGEDPKNRKRMSNESRLKAAIELAQYMYPKLSATQVTGNEGRPLAVATYDVTELMRDPELVRAGQQLAIAMAGQDHKGLTGSTEKDPNSLDDHPGYGVGVRR
jgi:hypothetical protein